MPAERILTVHEVTSLFLKSHVKSVQDFLGREVDDAVIAVPLWFDDNARVAFQAAAENAGVKILQLLDEAGAASLVTITGPLEPDRTTLLIDLGESSLSLYVLSFCHGLIYVITSAHDPKINGEQIDMKLVKHFAKEFTRKMKTPLTVCPATDNGDKRAETKLQAHGERVAGRSELFCQVAQGWHRFHRFNQLPTLRHGRSEYKGWCWSGSSSWADFFNPKSWDW